MFMFNFENNMKKIKKKKKNNIENKIFLQKKTSHTQIKTNSIVISLLSHLSNSVNINCITFFYFQYCLGDFWVISINSWLILFIIFRNTFSKERSIIIKVMLNKNFLSSSHYYCIICMYNNMEYVIFILAN